MKNPKISGSAEVQPDGQSSCNPALLAQPETQSTKRGPLTGSALFCFDCSVPGKPSEFFRCFSSDDGSPRYRCAGCAERWANEDH
jgi:hypothetical protein